MQVMELGMQVQTLQSENATKDKQITNYKKQLDEINQTMIDKLNPKGKKEKKGFFGGKKN